ncbi:CHAT domain-containing protein [Micromonospora humida]|uniref:CHAT domain-containing protein n=1 Tax=Micromonospora humida TaxID=2809018 RepID=UPI00342DDC6B
MSAYTGEGLALQERAEQTGSPVLLDRAEILLSAAVTAARADGQRLGVCLSNLAAAKILRFELTGDQAPLDEALTVYAEAMAVTVKNDPDWGVLTANHGAAMALAAQRSGDPATLRAAIAAQRQAVGQGGAEDRGLRLSNLANSLTTVYENTGDQEVLEEALEILREAVAAASTEAERASRLQNLAVASLQHYQFSADTDVLDAAVTAARESLTVTPSDHPDFTERLAVLSTLILLMSDRLGGDLDVLDLAAEGLREVLRRRHRSRAAHLSSLGTVCLRRFALSRQPADIDAAVEHYRDATRTVADGHPQRPGYLSNLGKALLDRYRSRPADADLDEAIRCLDAAIDATPAGHPDQAGFRLNLGDTHRQRGDEQAAVRAYQQAAAVQAAPPLVRARAARAQAQVLAASGDMTAALPAYAQVTGLLQVMAWHGLDAVDQLRILAEFAGVAGDAAACAIACGQPEYAVELLEEGRGVLLARALEVRTDDSPLRRARPDLAGRLDALRRQLDRGAGPPGGSAAAAAHRFTRLAREYSDLLTVIRSEPGLDGFLRRPAIADLYPAAENGPVIVVNVSRWRCDALILHDAATTSVPLPLLTAERVATAVRRHQRGGARRAGRLRDLLAFLWTAVAEPVLDALGIGADAGSSPRVWWSPAGELSLLPLHAAQRYDPVLGRDVGTMDRVVSSYTPTVRALLDGPAPGEAGPARVLVVTASEVPALAGLPRAEQEGRHLAALVGPASCTVLAGAAATTRRVLAALPDHQWFHFAGHSRQGDARAASAALLLPDGELSIRALARLRLAGVRFAFLSSCESQTGSRAVPDEAVHLSGALRLAGYRHVVAAQWPVRDDVAASVAAAIYGELTVGGVLAEAGAAHALHRAVAAMRHMRGPQDWAAFCHTGA